MPRARGLCDCWKLTSYVANICRFTMKTTKNPCYTGYLEKNKGVTFYSWGRRIISESMAPEVQAVWQENVNI